MVLYWSGTGNSAHIAAVLARALDDRLANLGERMRSGDNSPLVSEKRWVLVCPVYGWRVPRVVTDYLGRCTLRGSREMVVVVSCGTSSGNAQGYARRFFRSMGIRLAGFAEVRMPENYLALFETPGDEEARALNKWAERAIVRIARDLKDGRALKPRKVSLWGRFLSMACNPLFFRFLVHDRAFHVGATCTSCGLCERMCPLGDIFLSSDGTPRWKGRCTHCMACIAHCPRQAIDYGKMTEGRNRYRYRGF